MIIDTRESPPSFIQPSTWQSLIDDVAVGQQHPDWLHVAAGVEFRNWLAYQAEPVRRLTRSPLPSDAIRVLDAFATATAGAA